jgi:hypothetical protein
VPGPGAYTVYVWLTSFTSHFEKGSESPKWSSFVPRSVFCKEKHFILK